MKTLHLFLVLLLLPLFGSLNAQWSGDPTVNTPVYTSTTIAGSLGIVIGTDEGAFIIWVQGTSEWYMRFIDRSGNLLPTSGSNYLGYAWGLQACHDGNGNLIVARGGLYMQKWDKYGNKLWGTNEVRALIGASSMGRLNTSRNENHTIGILPDGSGGAIVLGKYNAGLRAQRVNGSGEVQWGSNGILVQAGDNTSPIEFTILNYAMLTTDMNGGAIVLCPLRINEPYSQTFSHYELRAYRLSATGALAWSQPTIVSNDLAETFESNMPYAQHSIISDNAGGAYIAFCKEGQDQYADLYAQHLTSSGSLTWSSAGMPISTASGAQEWCGMVLGISNTPIIYWSDRRVFYDVYCQRLSSTGQQMWSTNGVQVGLTAPGTLDPSAIPDSQGGMIIAYAEAGNNNDIKIQRINSNGQKEWASSGELVCTAAQSQRQVHLASDGSGGAIVAWSDGRVAPPGSGVYTSGVDANGNLYSNSPPTANAGSDQIVECSSTVTLDGSASTDPDNDALTYTWKEGSTVLYTGTADTYTTTLPIGTHTIDLTVEDPSNETSTDQVVITVEDTHAPVIACKPATVILVGGSATITTNDVDNGTSDACSAFTLSVAPSTFTCADIGANTVTLTATDAFNNVSTCTATVTVVGAVPSPTITVDPSPTVVNHANNTVYLGFGPQVVTLIASGDPNDSYLWSPATYLSDDDIYNPVLTINDAGTYTYTVTVTNANGCSGTASVTVEVLDWRCSNNVNQVKIMVCHGGHTICVAESAIQSHLDHGDYIGGCQASKAGTGIPTVFSLSQNYPNPFNPTTVIEYGIPEDGQVQIAVFDLFGREVDRLVNEFKQAGTYNLAFDGSMLPSGVYVYRLEASGKVLTRRMTLLK